MFNLNDKPKLIDITLKSSVTGLVSPKEFPYDNHHKKSIFEDISPISPPTTIPDNINTNNTHIFFSFVAICTTFLSTESNIVFYILFFKKLLYKNLV